MSLETISTLITALTSIIAILLAAYTFWFQTRQANQALGITILRDYERDFFYSPEMRRRRYEAARFLLDRPPGQAPSQACYEILDFFDGVGIYVNRGLVDTELAWTTFYYWFGVYWHCLREDVEALHQWNYGVAYLWNCQAMYSRLTKWGERHRRLPVEKLRYTPDRLRQFFLEELTACEDAYPDKERTDQLPEKRRNSMAQSVPVEMG